MADKSFSYKYFNVTFPKEYVAHVEINRPQKLNAFFEQYVFNSNFVLLQLIPEKNQNVARTARHF